MPKALLHYLRMSPQKVRIVANAIRGSKVEAALDYLKFCPKRAAKPLWKLLRSGVANAREAKGIDIDNLYIKELLVGAGPSLKRSLPRARGQATPILKRTSHVKMVLEEKV